MVVEIWKTAKLGIYFRLLTRINEPKRERVIGGWRKLLNEEHFKIFGINKW